MGTSERKLGCGLEGSVGVWGPWERWHGEMLHSPRGTGMGAQAPAGRVDLRRRTYLPGDVVKTTICSTGHSGRWRAKAEGRVEKNGDTSSSGAEQMKARSAKVKRPG